MTCIDKLTLSGPNDAILAELIARSRSDPEVVRDFWRLMLVCFNTSRPSTNYDGIDKQERTHAIRAAVKQVSVNANLRYAEDKVGNIIVSNQAVVTSGPARYCFQGHMDVVVSKNESVVHNFETEGVDVQITPEGTIKPVKGITLGADNGVAIACGLAVLINNPTIPLELLITKNEETSFCGACGLDASFITASSILNLDSEVENAICVGSAGGFEQRFTLDLHRESTVPTAAHQYVVRVKDLKGGHSGIDIDKNKLNGIQAIFEILNVEKIQLVSVNSGTSSNSIPREAVAVIQTDDLSVLESIKSRFADLRKEILDVEPTMVLEIEPIEKPTATPAFTESESQRLIGFIFALGNGVVRRSNQTNGVESSYNLGYISTVGSVVKLKFLVRSTSATWMGRFAQQLAAVGRLAGAACESFQGYFGSWEPCFESKIISDLIKAHPGKSEEVKLYTVHAGLECSTILEKFADIGRTGMECASIGPQIENAHSPDECLFIDSAVNFVKWVDNLVKQE